MESFTPGMLGSVTEFLTCGTDSGSETQRVNPLFHGFIFSLHIKELVEMYCMSVKHYGEHVIPDGGRFSALAFSYIGFAVQIFSNKNTGGQVWLVRLKIADVFP
ncbi:hypothetical protein KDV70_17860 [Citrobacter cronae]|uniref:hypothetical protein n=1 Tax=Citrobacter TaxID=544 RepID=UPI00148598D3|nr:MULTISPECIES: hypothetical protein [Citrobacter]MBU5387912.1 hypothetical protein [Citrobacter cronae]